MSSDRAEFSDAEIDGDFDQLPPSVNKTKPRKPIHKETTENMRGATNNEPTSGEDGNKSPKKQKDDREPQKKKSTTNTQNVFNLIWLIGFTITVAVIAVVLGYQQYIIQDLQSQLKTYRVPSGAPVPLHDYVLKTEFRREKDSLNLLKGNFEERRPLNQEWDEFKEKTEKLEKIPARVDKLEIQSNAFAALKNEIEEEFGDKEDREKEKEEYKKLQTSVSDMGEQIDTQEENVKKVTKNLDDFEDKYETDKKETIQWIEEQNKEAIDKVKDIKKRNDEKLKQLFEDLKTEFGDKIENLDSLSQDVKDKVYGVLMPNAFNKQNVLIAFFLLVLILGLAMLLMKNYGPNKEKGRNTRGAMESNNGPAATVPQVEHPILNNITLNRPVQNQLCVVSFNDHTPKLHTRLVEQTLQGLSREATKRCPLVYHNIRTHEQIVQLPPVKLYLLFVPFSERNVIIEEPFIGQGDIRRTTVQAITKLRGDYMIIYVKDPGSQRLPSNSKYNRDIYIVKRQDVLRELNQRGRFFSVYDKLTDFQRDCIQVILTDTFDM